MLLAMAVVVGAGVPTPGAFGAADAARPDRFVELRVCGATAYSRSQGRCTKDERRKAIASNRISCSVRLLTGQSGVWRARFRYAGAVETWGQGVKLREGPYHDHLLTLSTNIKTNQSLPGGDWACEFAFRAARAVVPFRSGGPVGEIVNTAVCPEPGVLSWGRDSKTCATDLSGKPLHLGESVYCSAVFAGVGGKSAQIQFLHADGSPVWVWNFDITWPTVDQGWAFTSAIKTAGDYLCRFKLSDGTTVDKPFRVLAD